jgi:hypothetical protein
MPTNLPKQVAIIVAGFQQSVESSLSDWLNMSSPAECQAGEEELHRLGRGLADEIFEAIVTGRITDVEFEAQVYVSAKGALKLSHGGHRETTFRLLGGREVRVNSLYMKPDRRGRPGRKRKHRGKSGSGLYPVLAALGISFGATPALANEVCWHMTAHDSVRGARAALDRRDIDLGQEGVLKLWGRVANRAVSQRDTWVEEVSRRSWRRQRRTGACCGESASTADAPRSALLRVGAGVKKPGTTSRSPNGGSPRNLSSTLWTTRASVSKTFGLSWTVRCEMPMRPSGWGRRI